MTEKTLAELIAMHKDKKVSVIYPGEKEPVYTTIAALDQLFKKESFAMREIFFANLILNGYTTSPGGGRFILVR